MSCAPPPTPSAPHTFSLSLWSGGVRGNGQERAGIELCPGHSWAAAQARQPVSASCCCCNAWAVLIPPVLGLQSQGDPSHREIPVTGKSRSQGNPGLRKCGSLANPSHWHQGCIFLPAATSSQAVIGHFQDRQKNITGDREELQPAVTKAMPKALLPPAPLCHCGSCPSTVLHLTISSVGCMPSQTDDRQILPMDIVIFQ